MDKQKLKQVVFEALGETSAVFMSQPIKATEIIMPTAELERIGNNLIHEIIKCFD